MSRRSTLTDDDDHSRPSIPIRLSKSNSWMDQPTKPSRDDSSIDASNQQRAVLRRNDQRRTTDETDAENNDEDKAEFDDGTDDERSEVTSVNAVRDYDDASADITSVGDSQAADLSIGSAVQPKRRPQISINPIEKNESKKTMTDESLTPAAANGASAFHKFTAEVSPDGPDLEVQLKEQDDMQQHTDRSSDDDNVDDVGVMEMDIPEAEENGQPDTLRFPAKQGLSTRTCLLIAATFILIVAGIGATVGGILAGSKNSAARFIKSPSPTQSPATSPYPLTSEPTKCSFCFDGALPRNLGNSTIKNNTSCLDFHNQLTQLVTSDPLCPTGQALAWRYCGCKSLPPAPVNPSCTLCPNGTSPRSASTKCKNLSALVAIVGSSRLSNCNDLRMQVLPSCSCPNNFTRSAALRVLLSPVSELSKTVNATNWQLAALNWISNEDFARIPPNRAQLLA